MFQPVKRKACGAKKINQPLTGNDFPLPAGFPSFMKLPIATSIEGLDACFVGVPMDNGTGYKPGARFAPREMRAESAIIRPCNPDTGAQPFNSLSVADIGDVPVNLFNVAKSCENIRESFNKIVKDGCVPLVMGGDHTITYPILQALGKKYGPLGVIYVDAHSDCAVSVAGERLTHSTSLRRAIEENFVDCKRVVQIGQRGTRVNVDPYQYEKDLGFRMIPAVDCWYKSLAPLMVEIREQMGTGPVYMSFCIDALDPAYAPGTGFPEIGGLTTIQAMEIIRGCKGLNMVGFEMDEVTPVYDSSGVTSATAGKLLYEMLCVVPSVKYAEK